MKRILVVEDNEANMYLTSFILKKNGYEVIEAINGEKGIELAIKEQLDLKKDSYPIENEIQNRTGWLFAAIARRLQDRGLVEFKKTGNRSYYRSRNTRL